MSLGRTIKQLRTARQLTQAELAKQVGIEQTYISQLERGSAGMPSREIVWRLADALHTTELYLLRADGWIRRQSDETPQLPHELEIIRQDLQNMTPEKAATRLEALREIWRILDHVDTTPPPPALPPQLQAIHNDMQNLPPEKATAQLDALAEIYRVLQANRS